MTPNPTAIRGILFPARSSLGSRSREHAATPDRPGPDQAAEVAAGQRPVRDDHGLGRLRRLLGHQRRGRVRLGDPDEGGHLPPPPGRDPRLRQAGEAVRAVPGAPRRGPGRPGRARSDSRPDDLRDREVLQPGDGEQPEHHRLAVHAHDLRPALHEGRQPRAGEPPPVPSQGGLAQVQGLCLLAASQDRHQATPGQAGGRWSSGTATTPSSATTSSDSSPRSR